ncbi:MAG: PQQ-like beta-propeller repeat protein [Gemmataceae bacterium]|nr:PQQ-like beta-propeller repeat protein [Gemmataceae bacterium]MCI0739502.1 PQQ-like beta-propeller repeat protein [Gemmataceae bacterium]
MIRLCQALVALCLSATAVVADDWPQWQGPKRDGVWRETDILEKFPKGGPKMLWKQPIGGGFSGPAVADGRVYVMDRVGDKLGKGKEVPGKDGLVSKERVLCFAADGGKLLWKHEYDCTYRIYYPSGPRATCTVAGGKVYALGAIGDLHCLDSQKGDVLWRMNLAEVGKTKPPVWGYAAHPLVDGDTVYCLAGGENSAVVALDKDTGKVRWQNLTVKEIGYAPPMIFEAGGKRQLIAWHTEAIAGLDPASGNVYWSHKFPEVEPERPGISVSTPRKEGDLLFVSSPHHGSLMLKFAKDKPDAAILWKGKSNQLARPDGLHSLMGSPVLQDGHVYGICVFGELRCLKADIGARLWEHPTQERKSLGPTTFLIPNGDRYFLFDDQGDLIIARLTSKGYEEVDRAHIIEPTLHSRGRDVVWCHPAFAQRCLFVRNDEQLICITLAKEP